MKPYWSDYVAHMTRYYIGNFSPETAIDKLNWKCVNECIEGYPDWLKDYYREPFVLTHSQWRVLKEYEKKTAKRRGLI